MRARLRGRLKKFAEYKKLGKLWPYLRPSRSLFGLSVALIPTISVLHLFQPILLQKAIDKGVSLGDRDYLFQIAMIYIVLVVVEYIVRSLQALSTSVVVQRMIRLLRKKIVNHVFRLSPSFHDEAMSGALVTRATSDCDNLSESLSQGILQILIDIVVLAGAVIGMFILDPTLAGLTIVVLPLSSYLILKFAQATKGALLAARAYLSSLNAFSQECLYGIRTVKLLTAEKEVIKKYRITSHQYRKAQMRVVTLDAFLFSFLDGLSAMTIGLVFWLISSRLGTLSSLTPGVAVAFVRYVQQMFDPLRQLAGALASLQGVLTSVDRIFGLLGRSQQVSGSKKLERLRGQVSFQNVSFSYRRGSMRLGDPSINVLQDVSFSVPAKSSLALVGATGSGKSTVIRLLAKLYDGYKGEIFIDHENLAYLDPFALRSHMSIVPQDVVLFDGSLAFNIALDETYDIEEVKRVSRSIGADQFVDTLPGGYDFKITEGGANLSEGQKQLIVFARALYGNPGLVILDEATASIDIESERLIQKATDRILQERTVVVIAHRLSTIRRCSQIAVLSQGRISELGSHEELIERKGEYFHLSQALS